MAKKKAKAKTATQVTQGMAVAYKADLQRLDEFKQWLNEFADSMGMTVTGMIDTSIRLHAESRKFRTMPKRLASRRKEAPK